MDKPSKPEVDLAASCACGAISVSVRGRILAMLLCSCLDCQKATGTGHSAVALAAPATVTITGETRSFVRPADSGALFTRRFCPTCGTPIAGSSSRAPEAIMLPVGLFGADTEWFVPNQLIFARSHHDWDAMAEGLPRYIRYRDSGEI
ncbi:GFA family protein [Paradevosia shaoguanensis]|uniref:GFA family protein n=1 Tax=Paradevosia shaoguanensis TaxID=1335043 RepID=UPI003C7158EC